MSRLEELLYKRFLDCKHEFDKFMYTSNRGTIEVPFFTDDTQNYVVLDLLNKRYKHIMYVSLSDNVYNLWRENYDTSLIDAYEYHILDLEKLLYE